MRDYIPDFILLIAGQFFLVFGAYAGVEFNAHRYVAVFAVATLLMAFGQIGSAIAIWRLAQLAVYKRRR